MSGIWCYALWFRPFQWSSFLERNWREEQLTHCLISGIEDIWFIETPLRWMWPKWLPDLLPNLSQSKAFEALCLLVPAFIQWSLGRHLESYASLMTTFFTEHEFYEDIVISPLVTERYPRWTVYLPKCVKGKRKRSNHVLPCHVYKWASVIMLLYKCS